jgi:hypothetical protein
MGEGGGMGIRHDLSHRLRARQLSSDSRAGVISRGRARRAQWAFVKTHIAWLATALLFIYAPFLIMAVFLPADLARGVMIGAGAVTAFAVVAFWVLEVTGTSAMLMGDAGEQWTASELRKLRRSGWMIVNHVALRVEDTDHVLIGPGGAFAVETKWSSQPWDLAGDRVRAACQQASDGAARLTRWHGFKSLAVTASPVVILWGGGVGGMDESEAVHSFNGVTVVLGPHARRWRDSLGAGALTTDQVRSAWKALDAQVRRHDPHEQRREPLPLGLSDLAIRAGLGLLAAFGGALAPAEAVSLTKSIWWGVLVAALVIGLGTALIRAGRVRYLAWPWTAGAVFTVLAVTASVIYAVVHS